MELRNRFKGLYLIDRVPNELWTEVCDIVQGTGIKIIHMENKCKKAKWLSEVALQIAVKRREVKSKGEKAGDHINTNSKALPWLSTPRQLPHWVSRRQWLREGPRHSQSRALALCLSLASPGPIRQKGGADVGSQVKV